MILEKRLREDTFKQRGPLTCSQDQITQMDAYTEVGVLNPFSTKVSVCTLFYVFYVFMYYVFIYFMYVCILNLKNKFMV